MTTLEQTLRELIAELVRDEVRRAVATATQPVEYLSTHAAAKVAKVTEGTIRRWVREGRLAEHRAGRLCRVCRADLERLLSTGRRHDGREPTPEELAAKIFGGGARR